MAEPRLTTSPETLRQYALLADGERGALIGPRGDVAFLCAPRWHDDAVFSDLLGGRGTYVVRPAARRFTWGGSYEAGSLIWRSRWTTGADVVESREALVFPGEGRRLTLLRRVEAAQGRPGSRSSSTAGRGSEPSGCDCVEAMTASGPAGRGALYLRWSGVPGGGSVDVARDGSAYLELDVAADEHHDLVLEVSHGAFDDDPPDPDRAWHLTEEALAPGRAAWRRLARPPATSPTPTRSCAG